MFMQNITIVIPNKLVILNQNRRLIYWLKKTLYADPKRKAKPKCKDGFTFI